LQLLVSLLHSAPFFLCFNRFPKTVAGAESHLANAGVVLLHNAQPKPAYYGVINYQMF
jgi:hypothetical protein